MNNAAINTIHSMLRVRLHTEEQTSCLQATDSMLAAESAQDALKVLHELIEVQGQNIYETLEKTMENLQDVFVKSVQDTLASCEISPEKRLVLRLSTQGELMLEGDGSVVKMVQASLDSSPLLTTLFKQIQARAMILQALDDIKAGLEVCFDQCAIDIYSRSPVYKMCIKGTLSHFYLQ